MVRNLHIHTKNHSKQSSRKLEKMRRRLGHGKVRQSFGDASGGVTSSKENINIHAFDDDPSYAYPGPDEDLNAGISASPVRRPIANGIVGATKKHTQVRHAAAEPESSSVSIAGAIGHSVETAGT